MSSEKSYDFNKSFELSIWKQKLAPFIFSFDNGSGIGDHENLNGPPKYSDFDDSKKDAYDDCKAKYYVARRNDTHQPWNKNEDSVRFTRLSDSGYPINPIYLRESEIQESLIDIDSQMAIPVEFRLE